MRRPGQIKNISWNDSCLKLPHVCVCVDILPKMIYKFKPEWPRRLWFEGHRQLSTFFDSPELPNTVDGPIPRFQSRTILSTPAEANVFPLPDHRTQFTHASMSSNVHSFFVTFGEFSAFSSMTGSKLQIITRPASLPWPPVANRVPSGWMSTEYIGFPRKKRGKIWQNHNKFHVSTIIRPPLIVAGFEWTILWNNMWFTHRCGLQMLALSISSQEEALYYWICNEFNIHIVN